MIVMGDVVTTYLESNTEYYNKQARGNSQLKTMIVVDTDVRERSHARDG
jgi:hypothetical protein